MASEIETDDSASSQVVPHKSLMQQGFLTVDEWEWYESPEYISTLKAAPFVEITSQFIRVKMEYGGEYIETLRAPIVSGKLEIRSHLFPASEDAIQLIHENIKYMLEKAGPAQQDKFLFANEFDRNNEFRTPRAKYFLKLQEKVLRESGYNLQVPYKGFLHGLFGRLRWYVYYEDDGEITLENRETWIPEHEPQFPIMKITDDTVLYEYFPNDHGAPIPQGAVRLTLRDSGPQFLRPGKTM